MMVNFSAFITSKGFVFAFGSGSHSINIVEALYRNKYNKKIGNDQMCRNLESNEILVSDSYKEFKKAIYKEFDIPEDVYVFDREDLKKIYAKYKVIAFHSLGPAEIVCVHKPTKKQIKRLKAMYNKKQIDFLEYSRIVTDELIGLVPNFKRKLIKDAPLADVYAAVKESGYWKCNDQFINDLRIYKELEGYTHCCMNGVWLQDSVISTNDKDKYYFSLWGVITACDEKGNDIKSFVCNKDRYEAYAALREKEKKVIN